MKLKYTSFKKNESGMALLMVISAITILTFILAEFTFDTKVNILKVYNQQDQSQARLNAESGITFAMAKLKMYKEARNLLAKNKSLPVSIADIESVITEPFIFPIPIDEKQMSIIQQQAIKDFTESILLKGTLIVTIDPVNAFLNPNNLIILSSSEEFEEKPEGNSEFIPLHEATRDEFIKMIETSLAHEREINSNYNVIYRDLEPENLVGELMFYINAPGRYESNNVQSFQRPYLENNIKPKHGPLISIDELYLLQGWNDAIVDLIKDRLSVHSANTIALNEITDKQLVFLFPDITEEQLKEFFKRRDGDIENNMGPSPFRGTEDFERLIVSELNVVDKSKYDERIKELGRANMRFGIASAIFKITSIAEVGRSRYSIEAYADIPILSPPSQKINNEKEKTRDAQQANSPPPSPSNINQNENKKEEKGPVLLDPRIVEIKIL